MGISPHSEPRDTTAHCHCRCTRCIFSHFFSCLRRNVPSGLWCPGLRTRMSHVFLHSQNAVRLIRREDCSCHAHHTSRKQFLKIFLPDLHKRFIKKNPTRCNSVSNFVIPYLYEDQHFSGETPPIIRSLKLHWQPLVFHTWKVVCTCSWWTLSGTVCLTTSTNYTYKQPSTYEKPEVASESLGSWWWAMCRPKHVELHINME